MQQPEAEHGEGNPDALSLCAQQPAQDGGVGVGSGGLSSVGSSSSSSDISGAAALLSLLPTPLRALDVRTLTDIQRAYPQLTELNLDHNELEFSSIPPLLSTYLPSLRSIDLSHNRLTRVPDLGALPHLTELRLRHNQLLHIEHLARNHPALVTLDLAQNQFQQLPTLCAELIIECPSLTSLHLDGNPLPSLEYRAALISLLVDLRSLDGHPVPPEEKAYLLLLAASSSASSQQQQLNGGNEGQQLEPAQSAQSQRADAGATEAPAQWAQAVAPGASGSVVAQSHQGAELHVQDVDLDAELPHQHPPPREVVAAAAAVAQEAHHDSDASSPLVISPGPNPDDDDEEEEQRSFHGSGPGAVQSQQRQHYQQPRQRQQQQPRDPFEQQERKQLDDAYAHAAVQQAHAARSADRTPAVRSQQQAPPRAPGASQPRHHRAGSAATDSDIGSEHSSSDSMRSEHSSSSPSEAHVVRHDNGMRDADVPAVAQASGSARRHRANVQHYPPPQPVVSVQDSSSSPSFPVAVPTVPVQAQSYPLPYAAPFLQQPQSWQPASPAYPYATAVPHPQAHFHLPQHPPAGAFAGAPAAMPASVAASDAVSAAAAAATASALAEQSSLVERLRAEMQELKDSLAREQAVVRSVKAYYGTAAGGAAAHQEEKHAPQPRKALSHSGSNASLGQAAPGSTSSLPLFPPLPDATAASAAAAKAAATAAELDSLRGEVSHLRQQNQLLQVQNDSTNEILRLKDRLTEQARQKQRGDLSAASMAPDLSTLWRDKVFALLVQNKSLLLTHAADIKDYRSQLATKAAQHTALEQQHVLLQTSHAAAQAQLQLLHNDSARRVHLQEQAHLLQSQAQAHAARVGRDVVAIKHVLGVFEQQLLRMEDQTRAKLEGKLLQFNRRIGFAQQRVEVVRAIKLRKHGNVAAAARAGEMLLPREEAKEIDELDDEAAREDPATRDLRQELVRLQSDRALLYSSWQREAGTLRSEAAAASVARAAAEANAKALQGELSLSKVECSYLASQVTELRKEVGEKIDKSALAQVQAESERKLEALQEELSAVTGQLSALKASSDAAHKVHLRTQVELQQARAALSQAKSDAAELSSAKYEYLEEKLRRRDAEVEALTQDKRNLQQQVRDMEQQIVLLRYGVGVAAPPPVAAMPSSFIAAGAAPPAAVAPSASALHQLPSRSASGTNSFSNLLFGHPNGSSSAGGNAPAIKAFARPAPIQHVATPQRHEVQSTASAPPPQPSGGTAWQQPASHAASSASLLQHDYPIPAAFGHAAAALEQGLSASSSRAQSRVHSVAPSPLRARNDVPSNGVRVPAVPAGGSASLPGAPAGPLVPPLRFPSASTGSSSMGVSTPPLASTAAPVGPGAAASASSGSHSSRAPSADLSRKISHLAALSARLLDDDD